MKFSASSALLTLSLFRSVPSVYGWGELGHRTVAYLAQMYMNDTALDYVNGLLGTEDISKAALYPDEHRDQMKWSAPWHYVDAEDTPPAACGIVLSSSCPKEGCVISAIANETKIINDPKRSKEDRVMALRFIIHFIGDMHQPLHTDGIERGGNNIKVVFDRRPTSLHSVWDGSIPNKLRVQPGENLQLAARLWAAHLYSQDKSGSGSTEFNAAAECAGLDVAEKCTLDWASEANLFVCSYVLRDGIDAIRGKELSGKYYEGAVPIVEKLVTHAGRRLAAYLTLLAKQHESMQVELLRTQEL